MTNTDLLNLNEVRNMKRTESVLYTTDKGVELIRLCNNYASIIVASCNSDQLEQLASACSAAAEELRSLEAAKVEA
jgi:hypothetical protein